MSNDDAITEGNVKLAAHLVFGAVGVVLCALVYWLGGTISNLNTVATELKSTVAAQAKTLEKFDVALTSLNARVADIQTEQARRTVQVYRVEALAERMKALSGRMTDLEKRLREAEKGR